MPILARWFWLIVTLACVVWYFTIAVYVAVKGALDIRHMLARLGEKKRGIPVDRIRN